MFEYLVSANQIRELVLVQLVIFPLTGRPLFPVQQVIYPKSQSEEALPHSHWGETAQVRTMQLFNQSGCSLKIAHYETHRRELTSMQSMRLNYNSIRPSEKVQKDSLWGKASQMHNV